MVSLWWFGVTARFWDSGRSPGTSRATGASKVPKPCGNGPCGEVSWDFEVAGGSATTPFWDPLLPIPLLPLLAPAPAHRVLPKVSLAQGVPSFSQHVGAPGALWASRGVPWRPGGPPRRSWGHLGPGATCRRCFADCSFLCRRCFVVLSLLSLWVCAFPWTSASLPSSSMFRELFVDVRRGRRRGGRSSDRNADCGPWQQQASIHIK